MMKYKYEIIEGVAWALIATCSAMLVFLAWYGALTAGWRIWPVA